MFLRCTIEHVNNKNSFQTNRLTEDERRYGIAVNGSSPTRLNEDWRQVVLDTAECWVTAKKKTC